ARPLDRRRSLLRASRAPPFDPPPRAARNFFRRVGCVHNCKGQPTRRKKSASGLEARAGRKLRRAREVSSWSGDEEGRRGDGVKGRRGDGATGRRGEGAT